MQPGPSEAITPPQWRKTDNELIEEYVGRLIREDETEIDPDTAIQVTANMDALYLTQDVSVLKKFPNGFLAAVKFYAEAANADGVESPYNGDSPAHLLQTAEDFLQHLVATQKNL